MKVVLLVFLFVSLNSFAQSPEDVIMKGLELQQAQKEFASVLMVIKPPAITQDQYDSLVENHNLLVNRMSTLEKENSEFSCANPPQTLDDVTVITNSLMKQSAENTSVKLLEKNKITRDQFDKIIKDSRLLSERVKVLELEQKKLIEACSGKVNQNKKKQPSTSPSGVKAKPAEVERN